VTRRRRKARRGARLPYADRATIAPEKLKDYALNPDHSEKMAKRAAAFASLLGIYRDDWRFLHDQILTRLPESEVTHVDLSSPYGVSFTVHVVIDGRNGTRAQVVTGWMVDLRRRPWLTTIYVRA
jgi:hypothetical protein